MNTAIHNVLILLSNKSLQNNSSIQTVHAPFDDWKETLVINTSVMTFGDCHEANYSGAYP